MAVYELAAVARAPAAAAPPALNRVGPVPFTSLTWTDKLHGVGGLDITCSVDTLNDDVRARLLNIGTHPTELWLYRDDILVAAGTVVTTDGDEEITVSAPDLLFYLGYMAVTEDKSFVGDDQHLIAAELVDDWQALSYGHYGIDTSGITTSGVTRTHTYLLAEQHQVLARILDLGDADDGFDVHIDPATRALVLDHPQRGSDLTGTVKIDERNAAAADVSTSVAPGDFGSDMYAVGTSPTDPPITTVASDTTVRSQFGRAAMFATFDGVPDPADLAAHAAAHLAPRTRQLLIPPGTLVPVPGADVGDFGVGDTVRYSYTSALGTRTGDYRIATRVVRVDDQNVETIAVTFE